MDRTVEHTRVMRLAQTTAILVLALTLGGCVVFPAPHTTRTFPAVDGVVTRGGIPLAGARVHGTERLGDEGCRVTEHFAETDAEGRFTLPRLSERRVFLLAGDRGLLWGFCIVAGTQVFEGWRARGIGIPPENASFSCELSDPPSRGYRGGGVCRERGD